MKKPKQLEFKFEFVTEPPAAREPDASQAQQPTKLIEAIKPAASAPALPRIQEGN
jgi:hypothetical protein